MPKTRTLDPEFWDDTAIDALTRDERLLVVAMITLLADDEGRMVAEPTVLKKRVFGVDNDVTAAHVDRMTQHIAAVWRNCELYEVDGQRYAFLRNFQKKQKIRYVVESKLPEPETGNPCVFSDCATLPKNSADFPRVELSRVERTSNEVLLSGSETDPDPDVAEAVAEYNAIADEWSKPKLSPKRAAKLTSKLIKTRSTIRQEHSDFTMAAAVRRLRDQEEFFREWSTWDLEWFTGTKRGRHNAEKVWLGLYVRGSPGRGSPRTPQLELVNANQPNRGRYDDYAPPDD